MLRDMVESNQARGPFVALKIYDVLADVRRTLARAIEEGVCSDWLAIKSDVGGSDPFQIRA